MNSNNWANFNPGDFGQDERNRLPVDNVYPQQNNYNGFGVHPNNFYFGGHVNPGFEQPQMPSPMYPANRLNHGSRFQKLNATVLRRRTTLLHHQDIQNQQPSGLTKQCKTLREQMRDISDNETLSIVQVAKIIRKKLEEDNEGKASEFNTWKQGKLNMWKQFKADTKNKIYEIGLWSGALKKIQGYYGTGILSYYWFLRWLLFMNIAISVVMFGITTGPFVGLKTASFDQYLSYHTNWTQHELIKQAETCSRNYEKPLMEQTGKELASERILSFLQGTGWMENTIMFYGAYHNKTLTSSPMSDDSHDYNMALAYLLATGLYFIISFLLIVRTSAKGLKENVVSAESIVIPYFNKVFGTWDFCISVEKAVRRKKMSLSQELQADLAEQREEWKRKNRNFRTKLTLYTRRFFINLIIIFILVGCLYLIYFSSDQLLKIQTTQNLNKYEQLSLQFLPSLVISILNIGIPVIFKGLTKFEEYSASFEIMVLLVRNVLLRLSSVGILIISLLQLLILKDKDKSVCGNNQWNVSDKGIKCWESYVGQQLYKLVLIDFVILVLVSMIAHTIRRIVYNRYNKNKLINFIGPQEFDLSESVLDLVYCQTLCWLSTFFSPLMPIITVLKLFIFFYVKQYYMLGADPTFYIIAYYTTTMESTFWKGVFIMKAVMFGSTLHQTKAFTLFYNCVASSRPIRATRTKSLFMWTLLLSFVLCVIPIGCVIGLIPPSQSCGPFRIYSRPEFFMFTTITDLVSTWPRAAQQFFTIITTPPVLVPLVLLLWLIIHYYWTVKEGHRKMTKLLKEQLKLGGKDKQFLLEEVNKRMGGRGLNAT